MIPVDVGAVRDPRALGFPRELGTLGRCDARQHFGLLDLPAFREIGFRRSRTGNETGGCHGYGGDELQELTALELHSPSPISDGT